MRTAVLLVVLAGLVGVPASVDAQVQQGPGPDGQQVQSQGLPPREVQQLLDGYAVIQGQEFLGLNDTQFGQFLPKFRALQEARRRNEMERVRLLVELNRLTSSRVGQVSENDVRERLRMLRDVESRAVSEIQKARDAIDQTLDLRQQGRFRVFEEQIEHRKLQLLMQVRQNRGNRPLARPQQ